jgi:YARHG domain
MRCASQPLRLCYCAFEPKLGHRNKFFEAAMSLRHLIIGSLFLTLAAAPAAHAQLSEYSCDALWHERNTIYARNGYCFKTDRAIEAFGRGCFPPF